MTTWPTCSRRAGKHKEVAGTLRGRRRRATGDRVGPTDEAVLRAKVGLALALLRTRSALDEAIALITEVVTARTAALGEDHPQTLASKGTLAYILEHGGRPEEAIRLPRGGGRRRDPHLRARASRGDQAQEQPGGLLRTAWARPRTPSRSTANSWR